MTDGVITTEQQLRDLIPEPSSKVKLKILPRLERHSRYMIGVAPLAALAARDARGLSTVSVRNGLGTVVAVDDKTLHVADPDGALRRAWSPDARIGGLFLVPGIGETLRVNGRVTGHADDAPLAITVDEVYLQCPKALVRSELWKPHTWRTDPPVDDDDRSTAALSPAQRAFIDRSPFALIATANAAGETDVSPRGDPSGSFIRVLDERTLLMPDRTGNHLVDTLRNILTAPDVSLACLIPGDPRILHLRARASITTDAALLAASALQNKTPKVCVLLALDEARLERAALVGAWNRDALVDPKDFPSMGEMILDQINPSGKTLNKIGSKLFDLGNAFHKKRRLY